MWLVCGKSQMVAFLGKYFFSKGVLSIPLVTIEFLKLVKVTAGGVQEDFTSEPLTIGSSLVSFYSKLIYFFHLRHLFLQTQLELSIVKYIDISVPENINDCLELLYIVKYKRGDIIQQQIFLVLLSNFFFT